jgi:hypothetical protein
MKMNFFECEIYMFGTTHTIIVQTEHTLKEIKSDRNLHEKLVKDAMLKGKIHVQSYIEQID